MPFFVFAYWYAAYAVIMVISTVLSIVLRPKPNLPNVLPSNRGTVPLAGEGENIPVVFGTAWVRQPNVVYYGKVHPQAIKQELKQDSS